MRKPTRHLAGIAALALLAACATAPRRPVPIPAYLMDPFAKAGIYGVASITYRDLNGRIIGPDAFATGYDATKTFSMTKEHADGLPDITLTLQPKRPGSAASDAARDTPIGAAPPAPDNAQRAPNAKAVIDFRTCPRPIYPAEDLRGRHTGTVTLRFLVGTDGYVKKAEIAASSGYPGLDQAAMVSLVRCHFSPALADGVPQETWSPVQYVWSMQ